jgi:hypothetical protein
MIIRPSYDTSTAVAAQWAEMVSDVAVKRGHRVSVLRSPDVIRLWVEAQLRQDPPELLLFYGHGEHQALYGDRGEVLFDASNAHLLSNCITYAVACQMGTLLAGQISRHRSAACIGYHATFPVPYDEPFTSAFGRAANSVALDILEGRTCGRAVATGRDAFHSLYSDLSMARTGDSELLAMQAAECMVSLTCQGYEFTRLPRAA